MSNRTLAMSVLVLLLLAGVASVNRLESKVQAVAPDSQADNDVAKVGAAETISTVPLPSLIVIDPGHGGDDPGAPSVVGVPEKDITLALSLKLATDLEQDGYRVELTRTDDVNHSLAERLSLSLGPDTPAFYLSVHANSYEAASTIRGLEIHIYNPKKYTNSKYPGIPAAALVSSESKRISESIIRNIMLHPVGIPVRDLPGQADGIRYDADYLVRLNPAPSALIELGYLSNPLDAKLLTDPFVQSLYAKDIAAGIAEAVAPTEEDTPSDTPSTNPPSNQTAS